MARISHTSEKSNSSNNPTKKYLEWKSNDKSFEFYDKDSKKKVQVGLPLKFIFLQHYHTVKGWNDASESGIYSNEVYYVGSEPLTVRAFKGGEIASGIYKDIKQEITNAGGKYHRSIYIMLEDGSVANLSIKGAVVKEWSDFFSDNKSVLDNTWIEIKSSKDQKKGSIKYSTPEFRLGANLSSKDIDLADQSASSLKVYLDDYFRKNEDVEAEDADLGI